MSKTIVIVEDNVELSNLLKVLLRKANYKVVTFYDGDEFLDKYRDLVFHLAILDLQLPTISGIEICKILKSNLSTASIPVIALTARNDEFDIVNGLNLGFDDYITKPFSQNILLARITAAIRKNSLLFASEDKLPHLEGIEVKENSMQVFVDGNDIKLSSHEFKTFMFLAKNSGRVLTREQILDAVNDSSDMVGDRAIDTVVSKIRKKLKYYAKLIVSVYGAGYMFKQET